MQPTGTVMVLESGDTRVPYMVRGTMKVLDEIVLLPAPLRQDCEARRWHTEGGEICIALSEAGKLLEPLPTFGAMVLRGDRHASRPPRGESVCADARLLLRKRRQLNAG